jgi:hypothetical protein
MRLHQSWYRAAVLGLPVGTGPLAHHTAQYGNMLTKEDGERGANFLLPEIAALAMRRQTEAARRIERHRLLCNMLSSQPMCFNLFGPAALDETLVLKLAAALLGRPLRRVRRVVFEHEPAPRAAHLADGTTFDAFIEVEDQTGALGFLGIETKLTEPFSPKRYGIDERPAYRRWVDHGRAPWPGAPVERLEAVGVNQLFRNHALAVAVRHRPGSEYAFGASAVVRHPGDTKCEEAVASYRALVRDDADVPLLDLRLDELVRLLAPITEGTRFRSWLEALSRRYVVTTESDFLVSQSRRQKS